ncbi:MAG: hypothetical protein ACREUS_14350 [Burkholderiales bacterium]
MDFLITLAQAASALLLLYGGFLVLMPRRAPAMDPALEDQILLVRHLQHDA